MPAAGLCSTLCLSRAVPLLRRFVDARLLVTDRDTDGRETIEVAHEALLRTWPQLAGWLAEDRDKLRLLESLQRAAEEWELGGRRDDLLVHRDARLEDARGAGRDAALRPARRLDGAAVPQRLPRGPVGPRGRAKKDQRQAELRHAQRIARSRRPRPRRTLLALVAVVLVAVLAVWQSLEANHAKDRAQESARQAIASRLLNEANDMLAQHRSGGDVQALQNSWPPTPLPRTPTLVDYLTASSNGSAPLRSRPPDRGDRCGV